jgi:hypothetical protein
LTKNGPCVRRGLGPFARVVCRTSYSAVRCTYHAVRIPLDVWRVATRWTTRAHGPGTLSHMQRLAKSSTSRTGRPRSRLCASQRHDHDVHCRAICARSCRAAAALLWLDLIVRRLWSRASNSSLSGSAIGPRAGLMHRITGAGPFSGSSQQGPGRSCRRTARRIPRANTWAIRGRVDRAMKRSRTPAAALRSRELRVWHARALAS